MTGPQLTPSSPLASLGKGASQVRGLRRAGERDGGIETWEDEGKPRGRRKRKQERIHKQDRTADGRKGGIGRKPPAQGNGIPRLDDWSPCSHLQPPTPTRHAASVNSQLSARGTIWAPKSNHTPSVFRVLSWLPSSPEYKFPQVPASLLWSGKQHQSGVTQRPFTPNCLRSSPSSAAC